MQLGKLGVWAAMDVLSAADGAAFAQRVEGWGYAALWLPESRGRDVLVHSSWLLANTKQLIVAPGIANIYARDPMAMANGQRALAEQSGWTLSARHRRVACAVGRRRARPYLPEAGGDDARLSRG